MTMMAKAEATAKTRACLMFGAEAEEAVTFYVSLLPDSRIERVVRVGGEKVVVVEFTLAGTPYLALNAGRDFTPNAANSISVLTADQAETDALWARLTEGGEESMCGWLADRYGFFWQIVPEALPRLMSGGDAAAGARVQAALMGMKKIDIAALERAHEGEDVR